MRLRFTKMHGAGNDFVVLDATRAPLELTPAHCATWATGASASAPTRSWSSSPAPTPGVDFRYRIFNASGGEVEHCGNGARCFVRYVHERGLTDEAPRAVETVNNLLELRAGRRRSRHGGHEPAGVRALPQIPFDAGGLTPPRGRGGFERWPLAAMGSRVEVAVLSMGNPHAVLRVADVDTAPVATLGPRSKRTRALRSRSTSASCRCSARRGRPARLRTRRRRDAGLRHRCLRRGGGRHAAGLAGRRR
jgi:diaminopimelate epimerase